MRIVDPAPGSWQITVIATRVRNPAYAERPAFRMRAALRPAPRLPDAPGTGRELLPNLRSAPPFELMFADCDDGSNWPDARCLRYAIGPANIGEGPLDLMVEAPPSEINPDGDPQGESIIKSPEYQMIHYSDGTVEKRRLDVDAGFHTAPDHMHYHHPATNGATLFKVDPATHELTQAAPAEKTGECLGDYWMADWHGFQQNHDIDVVEQATTNTCATPTPVFERFGLSVGWGDVYIAGLTGNQVHFPFPLEDGLYVLQATTNACPTTPWMANDSCHGTIIESSYTDNSAYAFFEVRNIDTAKPTIIPIERGLGTGPFDPARRKADDIRLFLHPPGDAVPFVVH